MPDPHGSVELVLDEAGSARAAYGYGAYGAEIPALTRPAAEIVVEGGVSA